jgi:hypothetical protein
MFLMDMTSGPARRNSSGKPKPEVRVDRGNTILCFDLGLVRVAAMNKSYSLVACILLALSLAIFTNFVSNNLSSRFFHQAETVRSQYRMLAGQPTLIDGQPTVIPQFYNRVLFPALFWLVARLGIFRDTQSYLLTRLLSALALFLAFLLIIRRAIRPDFRTAVAGVGLLAYVYIFTFNHGWEITSDYFDGIFTCLFILLALERKRAALLAVAILASFNRESSVFAGVIWFALYGVSRTRSIHWRETFYAASVCVAAYASAIGIRVVILGSRETFGSDAQAVISPVWWWRQEVLPFLQHPTASSWPVLAFAMVTPVFWWIRINREYMGERQTRLFAAGCVIGAITCLFGHSEELRVFIPALTVLIFTCVWLEVLRSRSGVSGTELSQDEQLAPL